MLTVDTNTFQDIKLAVLMGMPAEDCDRLQFGVIGLNKQGVAEVYNATEAKLAGLDPARVIGSHFFEAIAQCMNNFMVAQRFEDEPELDAVVPFVLTLRMRPTPVRLRLLASRSTARNYILIER